MSDFLKRGRVGLTRWNMSTPSQSPDNEGDFTSLKPSDTAPGSSAGEHGTLRGKMVKRNVVQLEDVVGEGAISVVASGRLINRFGLVGGHIEFGEEDPALLGLDIPYQPGRPVKDPATVKHIDAAVEEYWKNYLDMMDHAPEKAAEDFQNILQLIDADLLTENPRIAVKILKQGDADPERQRRFEKEYRLLRKLRHPNIVRRFGLVRDHELGHCMLLEYINGLTLEDHVQTFPNHAMPVEHAIPVLRDLAEALAYIHKEGITHRDIKPKNIMITKDGRVVITDFGIAKEANERPEDQMTQQGDIVGTPAFMAPEQVRSEPVTPATDMFQLGMVAFRMLTGRFPYKTDNYKEILYRVSDHNRDHDWHVREANSHVPPALETVIEVARMKNPKDRYTDAEFIRQLNKLIETKAYATTTAVPKPTEHEIREAYHDATVRRKEAAWDERRFGTQVRRFHIETRVMKINQLLDEKSYGPAKTELDQLLRETSEFPPRFEDIITNLNRLKERVNRVVAVDETAKLLDAAQEHYATKRFPSVGYALDRVRTLLEPLPKDEFSELHKKYELLRDTYQPHKTQVNMFNTVVNSVDEVSNGLEELYRGEKEGQLPAAARINTLLKEIADANSMLEAIDPNKIGEDYAAIKSRLPVLHEELDTLQKKTQSTK